MTIHYVPSLSTDDKGKNILGFKEKVTESEAKLQALKFGFTNQPLKVDNSGKFTKLKIG